MSLLYFSCITITINQFYLWVKVLENSRISKLVLFWSKFAKAEVELWLQQAIDGSYCVVNCSIAIGGEALWRHLIAQCSLAVTQLRSVTGCKVVLTRTKTSPVGGTLEEAALILTQTQKSPLSVAEVSCPCVMISYRLCGNSYTLWPNLPTWFVFLKKLNVDILIYS